MIKINFTLSEFNISGEPIPEKIADKILHYHIIPMQAVRNALNAYRTAKNQIKVFPSLKSGYRPFKWEKDNGRSGKSQHTFGERENGIIYDSELGATDWTCTDFKDHKKEMLDAIIMLTDYNRIAVYETFIHCDYKETPSGRREVYDSTPNSKWTLREKLSINRRKA